jgi:subtilisin family serine protease
MTRATLLRVLLAVALATAVAVREGHAQCTTLAAACPPTNGPTGPNGPGPTNLGGGHSGSSNNNVGWYVLGGVVAAVAGWAITTHLFPDPPGPGGRPPSRPSSPDQPLVSQQLPSGNQPPVWPPQAGTSTGGQPGGNRPGGTQTTQTAQTTQGLRRGFDVPPFGAPIVPNEVILDIPSTVPAQTLDQIAARHGMTRIETTSFRLTGRTMHRWRLNGGGSVQDMIRDIGGERQVAGAGANYLYALAEEQTVAANGDQYAPQKLNLAEAHRLAKGNRILVAVIDSEVDALHPDLVGAVVANFDASEEAEKPHSHGTGMAGAIAARRLMLGTAPRVGLLTVRAFSTKASSAEGTTFNILKGLDWAAGQGARVVNMSFAGPSDPRLREALAKAKQKGMVLIAAAGNAGPNSPPLFPAADPNVIAVTATDADDSLFTGANRGKHVAVAAPGVDILAPAPDGAYQFTTGTSVAAAEVSGVAALLIERNPLLTPDEVKKILMGTARDLGPKGHDPSFGAGLVNALQAVMAAKPDRLPPPGPALSRR